MKKKTSRILAMLLAALMVLSACGGNNSNSNDTSSNDSSNSSTSQENNGPGISDVQVDETLSLEEQLAQLKVDNGGTPLTTYRTYQTQANEMEDWLIHHTEKAQNLNVLANCYAFLQEVNNYGMLSRGAAESYETSEGNKVWTFHLQGGQKWVDYRGNVKADLVAQDYVTGIEWILNSWKNGGFNTSMLLSMLEGAQEYYDYTNSLPEAEALALTPDNEEFQKVGVKAPDDSTVVYTLTDGFTYFGTLATSAALCPLSQGEIDEIGVENMVGRDYTRMWYSGAYYVTEYFADNSKTLVKNPYYWDPDSTFEEVVITMVEDGNKANDMYFNGELDHATLSDDNLTLILNAGESDERYQYLAPTRLAKYSYCIIPNYDKKINTGTDANPVYVDDVNWTTALANENFRQALYHGINLYEYWVLSDPMDPLSQENLCWSMQGVCYFSDGRDYVDRVKELIGLDGESNGEDPLRFDLDKANEYKEKAIEELTALGVTFPVNIDYWGSGKSTTFPQSAQVLKECFEDYLGSDFVTVTPNFYTSNAQTEVYTPQLQSIYSGGWGADYGDIENFTDQIALGGYYDGKQAHYSTATAEGIDDVIALLETFNEMNDKAKAITADADERYEAFAQAEAFLLEHAIVIPYQYSRSWQLTHVNTYSMVNGIYGCQNYLYKNYETSSEPYTTEEMSKFAAAYELQR